MAPPNSSACEAAASAADCDLLVALHGRLGLPFGKAGLMASRKGSERCVRYMVESGEQPTLEWLIAAAETGNSVCMAYIYRALWYRGPPDYGRRVHYKPPGRLRKYLTGSQVMAAAVVHNNIDCLREGHALHLPLTSDLPTLAALHGSEQCLGLLRQWGCPSRHDVAIVTAKSAEQ